MGSLLPQQGELAKFAQLYMLSGDEATDARFQHYARLSDHISREHMEELHAELTTHHFMAKKFACVWSSLRDRADDAIPDFRLVIKDGMQAAGAPQIIIEDVVVDKRTFAQPASTGMARGEVAGAIILDNDDEVATGRDIRITYRGDGRVFCISERHYAIDSLAYPLLHSHGETGYHFTSKTRDGTKLHMNQYYTFYCQQRNPLRDFNMIMRSQRLMQEYFVSSYARYELERLDYFRFNQSVIRADLYTDDIEPGDRGAAGERIILPSSFIGGPRWYSVTYQDTLAIAKVHGPPSLFITVTCNPLWEEIAGSLLQGQKAVDRPDICVRVFRLKLDAIMKDIVDGALGVINGYCYTIGK